MSDDDDLQTLDNLVKAAGPGSDPTYPTTLDDDHQAAGFEVREIRSPNGGGYMFEASTIRALVRDLPDRKRAIVMKSPHGGLVYAIWTDTGRVAEDPAHSLQALLSRYPV